jgi:hypothetical protein
MKHGKEYERWQIAQEFDIPVSQVHTINLDKAAAYRAFLKSPSHRLQSWIENHTLMLMACECGIEW